MKLPYDALLIVAFGGPEKREDVIPFLENVLRGKPVPRERLLAVAEHYYHFDGVSPINAQVRTMKSALEEELARAGIDLPVYWGNRNWAPLLNDTVAQMARDGVTRALAIVTSAYSSYSSCRQYRENIEAARAAAGADAPAIDKLRVFYNHPSFVSTNAACVREVIAGWTTEETARAQLVFTAHSIPVSMARQCRYEAQLRETARLIAEELGWPADRWDLAFQSRSGRPEDPWLEPDILDRLTALHEQGVTHVVIDPIGFLSDHMEVLYDLDYEARHHAEQLGMTMLRAATVGTHPAVIEMVRELIEERLALRPERLAIGKDGPSHDVCAVDCCLLGMTARPASRT